ncbi:MAG TPA: response regulator [Anaerolineales bacterium]|nr:response regulator [Anaerolineales bacterium]
MAKTGDRILLVENDPDISDFIARQTLQSVGYQVEVASDSATAIKKSLQHPPDLIIADLNLPTLTAKDLLYALTSQGMDTPLLIIAHKGQEHDVIQAFRLGATDYILWPAREAEILAAVERALKRVHDAREKQRLHEQLGEMNRELQRKVQELTAILNLGKAVISITDQRILLQKIVEGAVQAVNATMAYLLLRAPESKSFLLAAQTGLPEGWAKKINSPLDDGVSSLVAISGETLEVAGDPLLKFKIASLGKSVCVVPIKVQREVIGILVVIRKEIQPFSKTEQTLLEAVADYASIALVHERLFRALNETVRASKEAQKRQSAAFEQFRSVMAEEVRAAVHSIDFLLTGMPGILNDEQKQTLHSVRMALQRLSNSAEKTLPPLAQVKNK